MKYAYNWFITSIKYKQSHWQHILLRTQVNSAHTLQVNSCTRTLVILNELESIELHMFIENIRVKTTNLCLHYISH